MKRAKVILVSMLSLVLVVSCQNNRGSATNQEAQSNTRQGIYPFSVHFGASLADLVATEGKVLPSTDVEYLTIYEYTRSWQGFLGTLSYLYVKQDDAVVAFSYDIPLGTGVTIEQVQAVAGQIYNKPTIEEYKNFFDLDSDEAEKLYNSYEHAQFFWRDDYLVHITEESQAGVINIVYSYVLAQEHTHP